MKENKLGSALFAGFGAALMLAAYSSVEARPMAIDFSPSVQGNDFGSDASNSGILSLSGDLSSTAIDLGFNIDFGLGAVSSVFINENGIVSFGAGLDAPFSGGSLASLVGPVGSGKPSAVIAPYYANLTSVNEAPGESIFTAGGESPDEDGGTTGSNQIFWQRGSADITPVNGPFDFDDSVPAFRVTWNGMLGLGTPVFTQLYLYSLPDGGFRTRFAYGSVLDDPTSDPPVPAQGSIAGYVLGANSVEFTGDYSLTDSFSFNFGPGGTTNPPPTPVSEPSMLGLFAGAIFAGGLFWLRNRRRTAIRPAHC